MVMAIIITAILEYEMFMQFMTTTFFIAPVDASKTEVYKKI